MCTRPMGFIFKRRPLPKHASDLTWIRHWAVTIDDLNEDERVMRSVAASLREDGYEVKCAIAGCGQCFECRLNRSRIWAGRCQVEADLYPPQDGVQKNWFVTLTYAPDHVYDLVSNATGNLTLHDPGPDKRDHLQRFNDALRKKYRQKYSHRGIRFFACGEYGDQNLRPHYHSILFNCPIPKDKLKPVFRNQFGTYYNSSLFEGTWPHGFAVITEANWTNMAYTARYIMKKQTGLGSAVYDELGIRPPFVRSSRNPGIALQDFKAWNLYMNDAPCDFTKYVDVDGELLPFDVVFDPEQYTDRIMHSARPGIQPFTRVPRVFDDRMNALDPDFMDEVKEHRQKIVRTNQNNRHRLLSLCDADLFEATEYLHSQEMSGLFRPADFYDSFA